MISQIDPAGVGLLSFESFCRGVATLMNSDNNEKADTGDRPGSGRRGRSVNCHQQSVTCVSKHSNITHNRGNQCSRRDASTESTKAWIFHI